MCKFRFWQFRDCGCHVFLQIITKIRTVLVGADCVVSDEVDERNRKKELGFSRGANSGFGIDRFHNILSAARKCGRFNAYSF